VSSTVNGERQTLTLSQPKTSKPIVTKLERRDYVVYAYHQKNLGSIRPEVFAPHIGEIYTTPVRNLLHFFGSSTRLQASPLDRFLIFDLFIQKIPRNYNGAYEENIRIL